MPYKTKEGRAACYQRNKKAQRAREQRSYKYDPVYRRKQLLKPYGLTVEAFEAMRTKQDNQCAICNKDLGLSPHVDHSAITSKVRGLLCRKCNTMLGLAEENIEILEIAREYLQLHGANDPHYQRAYQSRILEIKNPPDWASRIGQNDLYGNCPESWSWDM